MNKPTTTMRMMKQLAISLYLIFLSGCASVPITGRSQLNLISNDQVFPTSFKQYETVKKEGKIISGTPESEMVKRAGARIQKAVTDYFISEGKGEYLADYKWEFVLLDDPKMVNAWCMPGGKVAFYTGIIPICKDEAGVAVVMGHEIAHAIANHGRERISQQMAAQAGLTGLSIALGGGATSPVTNELILQSAGAATSLGILKFSREHESEADKLGLFFMAMAGYDPQQAPLFWERMSKESEGKAPPEFLSTHPSHDTRINDLKSWMPKALRFYEKSK